MRNGSRPVIRNMVLVRRDRPRYAEMVNRAQRADPREYLIDNDGIWIPEVWWHERGVCDG
jgi:hypothetical protein